MRKIEEQMIDAIANRKNWQKDNTSVHINEDDGCIVVRLFGNLISRIYSNQIFFTDAGWQSSTTKSRLNAIASHFNLPTISQRKHQWYIGNDIWTGTASFQINSQL